MDTLCYDGAMTNERFKKDLEALAVCTCGVSASGTVIVFMGTTEHHCPPPTPCWSDVPIPEMEVQ